MSYLINKVDKKDFAEFLLNPFQKAVYLGDVIYQKYPIDDLNDHIYMIKETSLVLYGRVNYEHQEVIERLRIVAIDPQSFIRTGELRASIARKIKADLDAMKASRAAEVKASDHYLAFMKEHKKICFESMMFHMLGAVEVTPYVSDTISSSIPKFIDSLSFDDLCNFRYGNLELVNKGVEDIFMSENFLLNYFIIDEIREEIKTIIDTGALTERQKHLQNIVKKTNDCGCVNFSVLTTKGLQYTCRNWIINQGKIFVIGDPDCQSIDFESVYKITAKGKVIYEKGVF